MASCLACGSSRIRALERAKSGGEMSAGESGDVGARPEDVRSRPLGAQPAAGSPPVDSINILARA